LLPDASPGVPDLGTSEPDAGGVRAVFAMRSVDANQKKKKKKRKQNVRKRRLIGIKTLAKTDINGD
jgi:hypothetical protein